MPILIIISLFSFLLFLSIFLKSKTISNYARTYSHFPGPTPLPLIGNLHLMLRDPAAPHRILRDLATRYGPLMHLQLGETHLLIISSADLAKQVMRTHDVHFARRPEMLVAEAMTYNYNDVIFAPCSDSWRQLKKIYAVELLSARRVQSFLPLRAAENMNMLKSIASCDGSPVNLSERLYSSSYNLITRAVIGAKTEELVTVTPLIEEIVKLTSGVVLADLYPSVKLLPWITGARFKIRQMRQKLDTLLEIVIDQHRAANADDGIEDLVNVLLKIQADAGEMPLTDDNIKAVIMDVFLAASETSATIVEWAMSEMIKNPSILSKAQEEVRRVFDDKGHIDEEKFDQLHYLKLIIKETLRFHPPSVAIVRRITSEICEMNGYKIPAESQVMVNVWALGRDPEYWTEPEKFEPERFEENSIDYKGNNFEYVPFGSGRRICPGIAFGLANVQFPLAMLLYHFDWKMPKEMKNEELDMTDASNGPSVARKHPLHLVPILRRPLLAAA